MRKHFAMMLVLAMLVLVLAGCMKTKVFEVNKNPSQSVVPQESSSEDATKPLRRRAVKHLRPRRNMTGARSRLRSRM